MGKGNAFLLSDGDKILLCDGTFIIFFSHPSIKDSQIVELNEIQELEKDVSCILSVTIFSVDNPKAFNNLYMVTDRKLGAGGTGEVFMAVDIWSRRQVVCKVVNLGKPIAGQVGGQQQPGTAAGTSWQKKLWREVELLKHISHVRAAASLLVILTSGIAKYYHR